MDSYFLFLSIFYQNDKSTFFVESSVEEANLFNAIVSCVAPLEQFFGYCRQL